MKHSPGFLKLVETAKGQIKETTIEAVCLRIASAAKTFVLMDVREDNEWAKGHLPGAIHMDGGFRGWTDLKLPVIND